MLAEAPRLSGITAEHHQIAKAVGLPTLQVELAHAAKVGMVDCTQHPSPKGPVFQELATALEGVGVTVRGVKAGMVATVTLTNQIQASQTRTGERMR